MTNEKLSGSDDTKGFYDKVGWRRQDGKVVDRHLFGVKEDGPIRQYLHGVHVERVRSALKRAGDRIGLLECGCGGNPSKNLLDLCAEYHGVDFSATGLVEARLQMAAEKVSIPYELKQADVCHLPFNDNQFDAVYSAHMLYHIPDPGAQKLALQEMLRVIKPNGVLVLITANPRPLLFPVRFFMRLVANISWVRQIAKSLGRQSPLPYKPMPLGWLRRQMEPLGSIEFMAYSMPSTYFYQHVTEFNGIGRQLWRLLCWLDVSFPHASAYLGNYVQVTVTKSAAG